VVPAPRMCGGRKATWSFCIATETWGKPWHSSQSLGATRCRRRWKKNVQNGDLSAVLPKRCLGGLAAPPHGLTPASRPPVPAWAAPPAAAAAGAVRSSQGTEVSPAKVRSRASLCVMLRPGCPVTVPAASRDALATCPQWRCAACNTCRVCGLGRTGRSRCRPARSRSRSPGGRATTRRTWQTSTACRSLSTSWCGAAPPWKPSAATRLMLGRSRSTACAPVPELPGCCALCGTRATCACVARRRRRATGW